MYFFKLSGSPPQVRGKLKRFASQKLWPRITPAGAGKTRVGRYFFPSSEDHPRRCGENSPMKTPTLAVLGSPPQVRGKRSASAFRAICLRITPAGAGKTCACDDTYLAVSGSPPQVRGKQINNFFNVIILRITPAGAGKTLRCVFWEWRAEDHPRRCGENKRSTGNKGAAYGITPAGAGKTCNN